MAYGVAEHLQQAGTRDNIGCHRSSPATLPTKQYSSTAYKAAPATARICHGARRSRHQYLDGSVAEPPFLQLGSREVEGDLTKWQIFKGWHRERSFWREVYARTVAGIFTALAVVLVGVAAGVIRVHKNFFRTVDYVSLGGLTLSVLSLVWALTRDFKDAREVRRRE